jgi:indolepyruvate ferredoxin oxidoreductase
MDFSQVGLDDKYTREHGRIFLSGIQALVRLPLMQQAHDRASGLNTAGLISGYRGSPLGAYDLSLWRSRQLLSASNIHFEPGLNEDLAATVVWGSQQSNILGKSKYDGVFGIWYGKGPGVDRCGDAFKHANFSGTSPHGGVLAVAGDDPGAESSTLPHQSEQAFMAAQIPTFAPADVREILLFGLMGFAASRFTGLWIGFKTVADVLNTSTSIDIAADMAHIVIPDFAMPPGGANIRWPDDRWDQERRVQEIKLPALRAFVRANGLDRITLGKPAPRLGIVTTGKTYLQMLQALADLGLDERAAEALGLAVYKVGVNWPLEPEGIRAFAEGAGEILVIEEKLSLIESQLKDQAYGWPADKRPAIVGKRDETGAPLVPASGELTAIQIAGFIVDRLARLGDHPIITESRNRHMARLGPPSNEVSESPYPSTLPANTAAMRIPHFCSGCPHNRSTVLPEGSIALTGIGCHSLAMWKHDRPTLTLPHMGAEGVTWVGQAPFSEMRHVFQNMGDGTYYHSGLLAIRAAVAAKTNITYKILYNDAVAMTGGQPVEGQPTVPQITLQLYAEGVRRIVVVTDDVNKYPIGAEFAPGVQVRHRDELLEIEKDLRDTPGVTALVYDQTCATELRRRRKRGRLPTPAQRAFINQEVCEGCGDCGDVSSCLSIVPIDTAFGRKRMIDQSSCNRDMSCVEGFCPSFVTVTGGAVQKGSVHPIVAEQVPLPEPDRPNYTDSYDIFLAGVGGTGVVTISALLGMAAHLEEKAVSTLDTTGLAQKGGAVTSHIRIAAHRDAVLPPRIEKAGADALIVCDMVVGMTPPAMSTIAKGATRAVVNTHQIPTAGLSFDPDARLDQAAMEDRFVTALGDDNCAMVDANTATGRLMGDTVFTNVFLLGHAYQQGMVPVSAAAIERAMELNGVAIDANKAAFRFGRRAAHDPAVLADALAPKSDGTRVPETLDDLIDHRAVHLTGYQNAAYAQTYRDFVATVRRAEQERIPGSEILTMAVAANLAKLMAYKDEYEVARLFTDGRFDQSVRGALGSDAKLRYHLAPPLIARADGPGGRPRKISFGPWIRPVFSVLAGLKGLRGTTFDPFGRTAERRMERQLITDYRDTVTSLLDRLSADNLETAVAIASLPEKIRGYGPVKARSVQAAQARQAELLAELDTPTRAAAE